MKAKVSLLQIPSVPSFASKFLPGYPSLLTKYLLYSVLNVNQFNKRASNVGQNQGSMEAEIAIWRKKYQKTPGKILYSIHTSLFCIRHGLIQLMLPTGYIILMTDIAADRPRCQHSPLSLGHMFCSCPPLYGF